MRNSLVLFTILLLGASSYGQDDATRGKEFWFCFPQNAKVGEAKIFQYVMITADRETRGTVESGGARRSFDVKPGEFTRVEFDSTLMMNNLMQRQTKAIHITAEKPVSVVAFSARKASTDSYHVLPLQALGREYRVAGYLAPVTDPSFTTQVQIVATDDNTTVTLLPTTSSKTIRTSDSLRMTISRGDVYEVRGSNHPGASSDFSGWLVKADKPVAVVTGHSCAQVPFDNTFCDVLIEMATPVQHWGVKTIVPHFYSRKPFLWRAYAHVPGTTLKTNDSIVAKLEAGEYYESPLTTETVIVESDRPVSIAQYCSSSDAAEKKVGDPFMTLVPPVAAYARSYSIATPQATPSPYSLANRWTRGDWAHQVVVIASDDAISTMELDGKDVDEQEFARIPNSDFKIAHFSLEPGAHTLTSDEPFGATVYGFGTGMDNYDSYGHHLGYSLTR